MICSGLTAMCKAHPGMFELAVGGCGGKTTCNTTSPVEGEEINNNAVFLVRSLQPEVITVRDAFAKFDIVAYVSTRIHQLCNSTASFLHDNRLLVVSTITLRQLLSTAVYTLISIIIPRYSITCFIARRQNLLMRPGYTMIVLACSVIIFSRIGGG